MKRVNFLFLSILLTSALPSKYQNRLVVGVLNILNNIENFEGDQSKLMNFVKSIDDLQYLIEPLDSLEKTLIFFRIRQKISGSKRNIVICSEHPVKWTEVRQCLLDNFGDHTPIEILKKGLLAVDLLGNQNNITSLRNEITMKQFRLLNGYFSQGSLTKGVIDEILKMGMFVFNREMPDNFKYIFLKKKPKSLAQAYWLIRNWINESYLKNRKGLNQKSLQNNIPSKFISQANLLKLNI
ncbi:hypothetical protein ACFFRR_010252 [Megaselia abdita]